LNDQRKETIGPNFKELQIGLQVRVKKRCFHFFFILDVAVLVLILYISNFLKQL